MSSTICASDGFNACGSILIEAIVPSHLATTFTAPPPLVASTVRVARLAWISPICCWRRWACFMNLPMLDIFLNPDVVFGRYFNSSASSTPEASQFRANASNFHGIRAPSRINTAASAPCGGLTPAFSRFNGFSECNGKPLKRLEFLHPTIHRAEAAVLMRKLDLLDAVALQV